MNLFTPIDDTVIQRLAFRRQFVLAPRKLDKFNHWNSKSVAGKWVIHAHPDLGLTQVRQATMELTLLGYCIDPDRPDLTDAEICTALLAGVASVDDLIQKTYRLAGRWVLVFCNGDDVFAFTDPCNLRMLFYVENSPEGPWCFSQPEAVKDVLNLTLNREACEDFFRTSYYLNSVEYWWPGCGTPYEGVKQLLPNHYLEVRTSKAIRFWPRSRLETKSLAKAVGEVSELLRGIFAGAARRFPLALPLTSGWDSRVLLAASEPFSKDIFYYTLQYNSLKQDRLDLEIPPRLLAKLGLPHGLIECPAGMAKSFAQIYFGNVSLAHYAHGPIAFGLFLHFPQGHVCLKGTCSEIARCFFYKHGQPEIMDGEMLAIKAAGLTRHTVYAVRHFDRWLKEAQPVSEAFSYNVLDLFQWEQKVAHFVATGEGQCDIVYEMLAPYNCRALLETLLSVPVRFRSHPNYVLYGKLIEGLWREALAEPINPEPLGDKVRTRIARCKKGAKTFLKRFK